MPEDTPKSPFAVRAAALALCASAGVLLIRAVLAIPETELGMAQVIEANLEASGVKNAVTAVLLNFRGYDTLLEVAVLVLATIGVLSMGVTRLGTWTPVAERADPVLSALTRFLAPIMILVSGYLLWAGEGAPGGAFQAGSVIGAGGVLLALSGYARPARVTQLALRAAISVGFAVFLATAIGTMLVGGMLMEYPADYAKTLILLVETWLTVSIAAILISLFVASASPAGERRRRLGDDE